MSANPYQPPNQPPALLRGFETDFTVERLAESGPIRFSGQPTSVDLTRLIKSYDRIGIIPLFLCAVSLPSFLIWAIGIQSMGLTLIATGISLVAIIALAVSSVAYRRRSFMAMNPGWNEPVEGEIRANGVMIRRGHSEVFLRWDCLSDIRGASRVIGFFVMSRFGTSVLVTESMFTDAIDEALINEVIQKVSRQLIGPIASRSRMVDALRKEPSRNRTLEVPHEAIAFEGPVYANEFSGNATRTMATQDRVRSMLAFGGMILGVLIAIAGILLVVIPDDPLLVSAILGLGTMLVWLLWRPKLKGGGVSSALVHYSLAFANASGVTSDSAAVVWQLPWQHLRLAKSGDDRMVLHHAESHRAIVIRKDMFDCEDEWRTVKEFAERSDQAAVN